jgi:hydrogenase small subunit
MSNKLRNIITNELAEPLYEETLGERLANAGISRRTFMKYCAGMASMMAIPASLVPKLAEAAWADTVPHVVYLSFQECTGCLESLVRQLPENTLPILT